MRITVSERMRSELEHVGIVGIAQLKDGCVGLQDTVSYDKRK